MWRTVLIRVGEAIVVEGRYDKNTLSQVVDTLILETAGFGIFHDLERIQLFRHVAQRRGLIILTDSDRAGFVIRNRLKNVIPAQYLKHAYIPDRFGKERRKTTPGKEGKLGVEGMPPDVLLSALHRAGATFLDGTDQTRIAGQLTTADLFAAGLSGGVNSARKRQLLLRRLDLPEHMSIRALLDVLNTCYSPEEAKALLE